MTKLSGYFFDPEVNLAKQNKTTITVQTTVNCPVEAAWKKWTSPEHVMRWNAASDDWHCPRAENDLKVGGKFTYRMEAKDGSFGFDFGGIYTAVVPHELIELALGDDRKVKIVFLPENHTTRIIESFEAEGMNPVELQRNGWQAILDNFKKYAEWN